MKLGIHGPEWSKLGPTGSTRADLGSLFEAKNDATLDVIHDLSAASDDFKIEKNEEKVLLLTSKLEQVDDEIRAIGRDSRTDQQGRLVYRY